MFNLSPTSWALVAMWAVILTALVYWGQTFRHRERNLMGKIHVWFLISGTVLAIAVGSLAFRGLNYGLDFTGGTILELAAYKQVTVDQVQTVLSEFKEPELGDKVVQVGADMVPDLAGKPYQRVVVRVTRAVPTADGGKELRDQEPVKLQEALQAKLGELKQLQIASIGPTITGELKQNAFLAVIVAMVVQCLYIFARFGFQWRFGVAADIAIVHDLVIMIGLYSLAGRQLDSPFVAAVLTVAGYSVMDSVVIFDRIRENLQHSRSKPFESIVNESVNQTMTRSINTTLTVIITLLAIYFFGGSTLQNFAFALMVGVTSGAYSSIFVASPLLVLIDRRWSIPRDETKSVAEQVASARAAAAIADPLDETDAETGTDSRRRRGRGPRRRP